MAGSVDAVNFGGYVVPVIGDRFYTPVLTAEQVNVVVSELIEIDLPSQTIKANGLVSWKHQI
ncbi:hypothetical protein D3C75_1280830 [compost metagenome]